MSCLGEPLRHVCVREPSGTVAQRIVCGVAEYSLQNEPMSNIIAICKKPYFATSCMVGLRLSPRSHPCESTHSLPTGRHICMTTGTATLAIVRVAYAIRIPLACDCHAVYY